VQPRFAGAAIERCNQVSLTYEQKKAVVAEVAEIAAGAHSLVAAEYSGLTVVRPTRVRRRASSRTTARRTTSWS
jgi:ribosomal protein L10